MDVTAFAHYTTDAPSVATMAGGTAMSLGPGTATITAAYMGQTTTMTVTVTVRTLAVASPDGVDFFVASAQGMATPLRSIRGAATTLQAASRLLAGSPAWSCSSRNSSADRDRRLGSHRPRATSRRSAGFDVGVRAGLSLAAKRHVDLRRRERRRARIRSRRRAGAAAPAAEITGNLTHHHGRRRHLDLPGRALRRDSCPRGGRGVLDPGERQRLLRRARSWAAFTGLASPTGVAVGFGPSS